MLHSPNWKILIVALIVLICILWFLLNNHWLLLLELIVVTSKVLLLFLLVELLIWLLGFVRLLVICWYGHLIVQLLVEWLSLRSIIQYA